MLLVSAAKKTTSKRTNLSSGVDLLAGVADGDSAYHVSVVESVHLPGVSRNARSHQSVRRKGNWLDLTVCAHVEGIGPVVKTYEGWVESDRIMNEMVKSENTVRESERESDKMIRSIRKE